MWHFGANYMNSGDCISAQPQGFQIAVRKYDSARKIAIESSSELPDTIAIAPVTDAIAPNASITKINVDDAFISDTRASTVGLIARDHYGAVIAAHAIPLAPLSESSQVEAVAITGGILLALELDCERMVIESDASNVVSQFLSDGLDLSVLNFHLSEACALYVQTPISWFDMSVDQST
ncbi:hypothetical protein F3Y22_tig00117056pilonHSYRG00528 [Hibiscus syriacus]|uniref:RNase H type-1 domain-containing protein n=1 Tax=Hibiscus syriacus TaxID=106335 RepID=A0A6A2XJG8_HIBSY|nr:hypothetical protein F3Y22_tig00117056pilonHSYRG00528 [Hibiscus syriacus]